MLSIPQLFAAADDDATALHDLDGLADDLRQGHLFHAHGHQAVTVFHAADLRVVLLAMRAGAYVHEHQVPAQATVQTLRGAVRLRVRDRAVTLRDGQLLALDRDVPHDVEATEDSVILVTIAWTGDASRAH